MTSIEYRPALFASPQRVVVERGAVELQALDGATRARLELADVAEARFVRARARRFVLTRLDLEDGRGGRVRIALNSPAFTPESDPATQGFREAVRAVASALAEARPELEIEVGESARVQLVWFCLGLVTLAFALGVPVLALATDVPARKLAAGAVPLVFMALIGAVITYTTRPWVPRPRVPIGAFAERAP